MWASHCCGTTWPSGPTASRATRTQARSTTLARLASKPVLGHASARTYWGKVAGPVAGDVAMPLAWLAAARWWRPQHMPACGPACERRSAWALGDKAGINAAAPRTSGGARWARKRADHRCVCAGMLAARDAAGPFLAGALARRRMKLALSIFQRPPTSRVRITSRARAALGKLRVRLPSPWPSGLAAGQPLR